MSAEQEQDTAAKSGKKLSALLVMGGRDYHRGRIPAAHLAVPRKRCIALVSQYQQHNVRRRTERDGDTALPGFTAG